MSGVYSSRKDYSNPGGINFVKEKEKFYTAKVTLDETESDSDLLQLWRQMRMPERNSLSLKDPISVSTVLQTESAAGLVISRKRKAWEGGPSSGSKYVGSGRLPLPPGSDEDESGTGLETPHCSRTGFDDEGPTVSESAVGESGAEDSSRPDERELQLEEQPSTTATTCPTKSVILSPMNPNILNVEDIDTDNLAADFDESFTGLGVDINTANYSMSEAMLSLNNIALTNQHLKQEGSRINCMKSDPHYLFSNYGALDLSNDEAQHPDHHSQDTPPPVGPNTFSGSVSRDNSQETTRNSNPQLQGNSGNNSKLYDKDESEESKLEKSSPSHRYQSMSNASGASSLHKSVLAFGNTELEKNVLGTEEVAGGGVNSPKLEVVSCAPTPDEESDASFQYILTAPTSIATKVGEPSLTYINQGQSYQVKIKKLGDISSHYKKKWLRSSIRICFHERRLQYIENEQITEWARTHPNERILEVDMPLSYGIADVKQEAGSLSTVNFSWDPTRETGVFIKVHCISTEFTPKKHGGERGVPFRLQVETWWSEARIHAAACILQVFKLKGADRKHKQDREKVQKRNLAEQEKFSPQYDCTVLTDLSVDSIYIPPSRANSPVQSDGEGGGGGCSTTAPNPPTQHVKAASLPPISTREESPYPPSQWPKPNSTADSKSWKKVLPSSATAETAAGWLNFNRYSQFVKTFHNYDSRDLLRLSKEDLTQMIGLVEGTRLFNDLHLKPVGPRLILYIAQKGDSIFHPILLEEVTISELIKLIAHTFQIPEVMLAKIIITGPNKILVMMTDDYLRYQSPESAFYYSLVYEEGGDSCTLHLEQLT